MKASRQKGRIWIAFSLMVALLCPPATLRASDPAPPEEPPSPTTEESKPEKEKNADRVLREMKAELGRYHEQSEANQRELFQEVQRAADDRRRQRRSNKVVYSCIFALVSSGILGAFFLGGGEHPLADRISVERKLVTYDEQQAAAAQKLLSVRIGEFINPDGSFKKELLPALATMGAVVRTELATDDGRGKIPNGLWRVMYEGDSDGSVSEKAREEGLVDGELIGDSFGKIRDFLKRADEMQLKAFDEVFAVALLNLLDNSRALAHGLDGDEAEGIFSEMTLGTFIFQEVLPLARLGAGASVQDGERFRIDPP